MENVCIYIMVALELFFSLTHCAGAVAAAVERRRPVVPALRRREERRRRQDGEQCEGSVHLYIVYLYLSVNNTDTEEEYVVVSVNQTRSSNA